MKVVVAIFGQSGSARKQTNPEMWPGFEVPILYIYIYIYDRMFQVTSPITIS